MVLSRIVFGNSTNMGEVCDGSVQLLVTTPPYYNAPFDYPNLFKNYEDFMHMIRTYSIFGMLLICHPNTVL